MIGQTASDQQIGTEPESGSVVALYHQYPDSERIYTYCAIRVGDGRRRWYLSGGSSAIRGSAPDSPCSWEDLWDFASGPVTVATGWRLVE